MSGTDDRPVVIASNRGPVSHRVEAGRLVARRGGGGLVSGLAPLVQEGRATWIAAALTEADREAARGESVHDGAEGVSAHLIELDPDDQRRFYDTVSNETLWFVHHGLFDPTRSPAYDDAWWAAWDAYRRVNGRFADAVCDLAPDGAVVLVQDYHLTLLAPQVRERRADLILVHFHHTPFAGPDGLRMLPPAARDELLSSLAAHHACGFHTDAWAANFTESLRHWGHGVGAVFASTLSSDAADLASVASSDACQGHYDRIDAALGGRACLVRVDRMELSKNIVRGFRAFDALLERRVDWRGRVDFLAHCYPSRTGVPAYARYRDEVEAAATAVNERWGTADWTPVQLVTEDDFPRSVASLRRADVLLVNPIRDGLNLVAKEGPLVNDHDGQLVLSTEAGAFTELREAADAVDPFDLVDTAAALEAALDRSPEQRRERATRLRELSSQRTPSDWLDDQLAAAGAGTQSGTGAAPDGSAA